MRIDLTRAREETPGCTYVTHFNNAGASLMPQPVLDAVHGHLDLEARIGGYEAARRAADATEGFYAASARLLGCKPEEIAFAQNASRAWAMAFYAVPFAPGDRILTAQAAFINNYLGFLHIAQKTGASVEVIPNDAHGQIDVAALRNAIDARVKLIAITHVPTNGGLVNPAAAVGAVAKEAGILYLLDACQSAGQMPLDVSTLGCDMLAATGRKFLRGPRGTGFLYVREEVAERLEPPFVGAGAADWVEINRYEFWPGARRFETWETSYAGRIGLGVAIDYALGWGLDAIWARVRTLASDLRAQLTTLPGVTVWDLGAEKCGIVTFTVAGKTPDAIMEALGEHNINVSVSRVNAARLDMDTRGLSAGMVRASVHYYNSEEEITRLCEAVARA